MRPRRDYVSLVLVAIAAGVVGAGIAFLVKNKTRVEVAVGETRSELLSLRAPAGTTEMNSAYKGAAWRATAAAASRKVHRAVKIL
jgi:hypothetical protein